MSSFGKSRRQETRLPFPGPLGHCAFCRSKVFFSWVSQAALRWFVLLVEKSKHDRENTTSNQSHCILNEKAKLCKEVDLLSCTNSITPGVLRFRNKARLLQFSFNRSVLAPNLLSSTCHLFWRMNSNLPTWIFCPVIELFFATSMKACAQSAKSVYSIFSTCQLVSKPIKTHILLQPRPLLHLSHFLGTILCSLQPPTNQYTLALQY